MKRIKTDIEVGPTKYSKGSVLVVGRYAEGGRLALRLVDRVTGEPELSATFNPTSHIEPDMLAIKIWSENEGVLEALLDAGVVGEPVGSVPAGHTAGTLCPYGPALKAVLAEHGED